MIKGCSRKVIVIKNTGSDMFDEAYFIINPKESGRKYSDFLSEANRIIASRTLEAGGRRKISFKKVFFSSVWFFVGACFSFFVAYFFLI